MQLKKNSESRYLRSVAAAIASTNSGQITKCNGTEIQTSLCCFHRTTTIMTEERKNKTFGFTHHVCLSTVHSHTTTILLKRYDFMKVIMQYYSWIKWPTRWCLHKQEFYDAENHAKHTNTLCEL